METKSKQTAIVDARHANENGELLFNLSSREICRLFFGYLESNHTCTTAIFEALETISEGGGDQFLTEYNSLISGTLSIIGLLDAAMIDITEISPHPDKKEAQKEAIPKVNDHFAKIINKINEKGIYDFITEAMNIIDIVKTRAALCDTMHAFGVILSLYIAYERSLSCEYMPQRRSKGIIDQ